MERFCVALLLSLILYSGQLSAQKTYFDLDSVKAEKDSVIKLNLSSRNLSSIPDIVYLCSNLKELNVEYNNIVTISDSIKYLNCLESIYLGGNVHLNQKKIFASLSVCKNLKTLSLHSCELKELCSDISVFSGLSKLILFNNLLTGIDESIKFSNSLKYLDLHYNQLASIPVQFCNVKYLDVQGNSLKTIDSAILRFKSLKVLNISDNQINEFPVLLFNLSGMQELIANRMKIGEMPNGIGAMKGLKVLSLNNCDITFISSDFSDLFIENLSLEGNINIDKTKLFEQICRLQTLKELNLRMNNINDVPECLGYLSNITVLDLSDNKLGLIPHAIYKLKNMRGLVLWQTGINNIDEEIGNLSALNYLVIGNNNLTELPQELDNCKYLGYINIWGNLFDEKKIGVLKSRFPNAYIEN